MRRPHPGCEAPVRIDRTPLQVAGPIKLGDVQTATFPAFHKIDKGSVGTSVEKGSMGTSVEIWGTLYTITARHCVLHFHPSPREEWDEDHKGQAQTNLNFFPASSFSHAGHLSKLASSPDSPLPITIQTSRIEDIPGREERVRVSTALFTDAVGQPPQIFAHFEDWDRSDFSRDYALISTKKVPQAVLPELQSQWNAAAILSLEGPIQRSMENGAANELMCQLNLAGESGRWAFDPPMRQICVCWGALSGFQIGLVSAISGHGTDIFEVKGLGDHIFGTSGDRSAVYTLQQENHGGIHFTLAFLGILVYKREDKVGLIKASNLFPKLENLLPRPTPAPIPAASVSTSNFVPRPRLNGGGRDLQVLARLHAVHVSRYHRYPVMHDTPGDLRIHGHPSQLRPHNHLDTPNPYQTHLSLLKNMRGNSCSREPLPFLKTLACSSILA